MSITLGTNYKDITDLLSRKELKDILIKKDKQYFSILLININGFKFINKYYGSENGDNVLAHLFNKVVRRYPESLIARIGVDEFAVLIESDEEEYLEREKNILNGEYSFNKIKYSVNIGYITKNKIDNIDNYFNDLETLYNNLKNSYIYENISYNDYLYYQMMKKDIKDAISDNQIDVFYQPQFSKDRKLSGLEALIRWWHPNKGYISPECFIYFSEKTGQITELTKIVLERVFNDVKTLKEDGLIDFNISVNISPFLLKKDSFKFFYKTLIKSDKDILKYIEFEITESALDKDTNCYFESIEKIRKLGISIVLDDFGKGLANIGYINNFNFKKVKIDKMFIKNISLESKSFTICKNIIKLCEELNVDVVSEGVENLEQFDILVLLNSTFFQGFFLSKPMSFDKTKKWIASYNK